MRPCFFVRVPGPVALLTTPVTGLHCRTRARGCCWLLEFAYTASRQALRSQRNPLIERMYSNPTVLLRRSRGDNVRNCQGREFSAGERAPKPPQPYL